MLSVDASNAIQKNTVLFEEWKLINPHSETKWSLNQLQEASDFNVTRLQQPYCRNLDLMHLYSDKLLRSHQAYM